MKNYLFILLAITIVFTGNTVLADSYTHSTTLKNGSYNSALDKINKKKLVEMENSLYGTVYDNQNLISRIERLENTVFNQYYPNYTLDQRVNNLIYSYNRRYNPVNPSLARRVANRINSTFVGVPTGFTPPIGYDPYSNYYNGGYGANNWTTYSPSGWSSYGPNGWRTYSSTRGGSTGVHIID